MTSPNSCQKDLSVCLLENPNIKSFITKAFDIFLRTHPKSSFADLARTMGYSSRSFVRQLALGNRSVNISNQQKIARGLELSPEASDYFSLLVEIQNAGSSVELELRAERAELQLRKSLEKTVRRIRKADPIPFERWPFVYASLGSETEGRSFLEIVRMSGQDPKVVADILDYLVKKEFIFWNERKMKYYPKTALVDLGELGKSRILKNLYKHTAMEALRRVDAELERKDALFHTSVFSIRMDQMPHLVKDFQKLLASYATTSEDPKGEQIAILNAMMLPMTRPG